MAEPGINIQLPLVNHEEFKQKSKADLTPFLSKEKWVECAGALRERPEAISGLSDRRPIAGEFRKKLPHGNH